MSKLHLKTMSVFSDQWAFVGRLSGRNDGQWKEELHAHHSGARPSAHLVEKEECSLHTKLQAAKTYLLDNVAITDLHQVKEFQNEHHPSFTLILMTGVANHPKCPQYQTIKTYKISRIRKKMQKTHREKESYI